MTRLQEMIMFASVYKLSVTLFRCFARYLAAPCFFAVALFSTSHATESVNSIAESVSAQIPEIITGGSWRKGNVGGFYRAMVVMPEVSLMAKKDRSAEVVIQWIGREDGKPNSRIFKTVRVKEVSKKRLKHAFLSMDTIKDNEMTLMVTSYDAVRDKDISISVRATLPGKYRPGK